MRALLESRWFGDLPALGFFMACLSVGIPLGYYWDDFRFGPKAVDRYELTQAELDAWRSTAESLERIEKMQPTWRAVCADPFAGSQVLRVQAENENLEPICVGRPHPRGK